MKSLFALIAIKTLLMTTFPTFSTQASEKLEPPRNLSGYQISNKFFNKTEYINVIRWEAPLNGRLPHSYKIYRDSGLTKVLSEVLANKPLIYEEHDCKKKKTYTYYLVSFYSIGTSEAVSVTISPK